MAMAAGQLVVEADVTAWILEYLAARQLFTAMRALERETAVLPGPAGVVPELAYMRELLVDGRFNDAVQFMAPLASTARCPENVSRQIFFAVRRQQFLELLCPEDAAADNAAPAATELQQCMHQLEVVAPSRQDFLSLCGLLSLPAPTAHADFRHWTAPAGRIALYSCLSQPMLSLLRGDTAGEVTTPQFSAPCVSKAAPECMLTQLLWRGLLHKDTALPSVLPFEPLHYPLPPPTPPCRLPQASQSSPLPDLREDGHGEDNTNGHQPDKRRKWQVPAQPADWKPAVMEEGSLINMVQAEMAAEPQRVPLPATTPATVVQVTQQKSLEQHSYPVSLPKSVTPPTQRSSAKASFVSAEAPAATPLVVKPAAVADQQDHYFPADFVLQSSDFQSTTVVEDVQALRTVAFHPSGQFMALGSNSRTLRVCSLDGRTEHKTVNTTICSQLKDHHRGSIYCCGWSSDGSLLASGSNDKTIKVVGFNADTWSTTSPPLELRPNLGTVRDLLFHGAPGAEENIISAGGGSFGLAMHSSSSGYSLGTLLGHTDQVTSLSAHAYVLASASADTTVKLWDMRTSTCIKTIPCPLGQGSGDGAAAVCLGSTALGPVCVGYESGQVMIYDLTAGKTRSLLAMHASECRSLALTPDDRWLLSSSFDTTAALICMASPTQSVTVGQHRDKIIQCRWNPTTPMFATSSADRTVHLWVPDI